MKNKKLFFLFFIYFHFYCACKPEPLLEFFSISENDALIIFIIRDRRFFFADAILFFKKLLFRFCVCNISFFFFYFFEFLFCEFPLITIANLLTIAVKPFIIFFRQIDKWCRIENSSIRHVEALAPPFHTDYIVLV